MEVPSAHSAAVAPDLNSAPSWEDPLDRVPVILWRAAANGYVRHLNKRWFEYTGTTPEQVRGRGWKDYVHPDDLEMLVETGRQYVASGKSIDCRARLRRFDGVYRWFLFRPAPVHDETGDVVAWYGAITDVEELKRAEDTVAESERKLKAIIDTIPTLAWSAHPDGSVDFLSQNYLDYVGLAPDQTLNWNWTAAVHPDDLPGLAAAWQAIMAAGEAGEAEARLRRFDGQYRWFLFRANPLRDESRNIVKWFGVNTDIQDRKRAEQALYRSEAFLTKGQQLSLTGSFSCDFETEKITWSDQLYRIFEFEPGIPITFDLIATRYHPGDRPTIAALAEQVRSGVKNFDYEHRLLLPDGSIKYLHVTATGTRNNDGRIEYFGAAQDVTRRRLADEALNKARAELAHMTRITSLGALTASIAHEVNQPLSGIITNANACLRMLGADPPNVERARETARRTIRDGNRASGVVARLRSLFSKEEPTFDPVDLNHATQEVIALLLNNLRANRVLVRTELADDIPPVQGDRVRLQQVIWNLIQNAIDAMSSVDDRPRELLIRTEQDQDALVRLSARDTGVGFGANATERLFETFYTTKNGGMGIGLSVSRSIIESHHGRLWVEPNEGPGVTFFFSLPRHFQGSTGIGRLDFARTHLGTPS
jgi:PAS domain S-box-containing protein